MDCTPPTPTNALSAPLPDASDHPLMTFGTYNYSHFEILDDATNQAMYLMSRYKQPPLIDTAMKYRNLPIILKVLETNPDVRIGWKVEHSARSKSVTSKVLSASQFRPSKTVLVPNTNKEQALLTGNEKEKGDASSPYDNVKIHSDSVDHQGGAKTLNAKNMYDGMEVLKANVPKDRIFRILLHNYCGKKAYLEFQSLVEREFGVDMPIGICNVSAEQLEDLLQLNALGTETDGDTQATGSKARVDWVQNEYHPFLETHVPEVCHKHGIRFEAHSVMTNIAGYANLFEKLGVPNAKVSEAKSAELALKYAAKQGSVCFATANFSHLKQDLRVLLAPQTDDGDDVLLSAMAQFSSFKRIVRYKGATTSMNTDWVKVCDPKQIREEILPKLKKDIALFEAHQIPSDLCIRIPKSYRAGGKVHGILAEMIYGQDLENQMDDLRKKLEQKMLRTEASKDHDDGDDNKVKQSISDEELKTRLVAKWNCTLASLLAKLRHCINKAQTKQRMVSKRAPKPMQAVQEPEAMPMDSYPDAGEFADFFQFLKTGGAADAGIQDFETELPVNIRFKHGTINSDGRLDLCKQGFRNAFSESCDAVIQDAEKRVPVNIRFKHGTINSDGRLDLCKQGFRNAFYQSCDAVIHDKQSPANSNTKSLIKHYLIGNNRIGEDGDIPGEGSRRIAALARMIRLRPDIVTWYLAGNSIDEQQIPCVAEALEQTQAKYVWLKMNPIKTGAYHLGKMIMKNPHIELLDLFNCGLCNNGLVAFAHGLSDGAAQNPSAPYSNLRHLYISINAIDSAGDVQKMLTFLPHLESLFLGMNPFADKGLEEIAHTLTHFAPCRKVLRRLNLGSMGLTDASLPLIERIVIACPNLVSLELDSYKSTNYFSQFHNRFDVGNAATRDQLLKISQALVSNAHQSSNDEKARSMHYLGLQHTLVVGTSPDNRTVMAAEAKVILDDFVENQLNKQAGVNVNGITNLFPHEDGKTYCHYDELTTLDEKEASEHEKDEEKEALPKPVRKDNSTTRMTGGGQVFTTGIAKEDLHDSVRHPWPAIDYIASIYRNTMKA